MFEVIADMCRPFYKGSHIINDRRHFDQHKPVPGWRTRDGLTAKDAGKGLSGYAKGDC
jgi:hypothetical protein